MDLSSLDTFYTLKSPSEYLLKEKGSKFYGFAFPVTNEEEVKQHLQDLRKQYFDASHHCFAYMMGIQKDKYRANDDGEPKNSAGVPILGQIRSFGLTNVLVVVVRYFGGTKLGVSGLVQTYKQTASETLAQATIIKQNVSSQILIQYDYAQLNELMRLFNKYEVEIQYLASTEKPEMKVSIRASQMNLLIENLKTLFSLNVIEL